MCVWWAPAGGCVSDRSWVARFRLTLNYHDIVDDEIVAIVKAPAPMRSHEIVSGLARSGITIAAAGVSAPDGDQLGGRS